MATTRLLRAHEVTKCLPLAHRFLKEAPHLGSNELNEDAFYRYWSEIYRQAAGNIIVAEVDGEIVGGIGATVSMDFITGRRVANELFLYVAPEHRTAHVARALFEAYLEWSRLVGATYVFANHLGHSMPEAVREMYESYGMEVHQVGYHKVLDEAEDEPNGG